MATTEDNRPVTRKFLRDEFKRELKKYATKNDLKNELKKYATKEDLITFKKEIIRHFDVVWEQLRHDVLGANRDEIELIKDKQLNHDERIIKLERHIGLMVV